MASATPDGWAASRRAMRSASRRRHSRDDGGFLGRDPDHAIAIQDATAMDGNVQSMGVTASTCAILELQLGIMVGVDRATGDVGRGWSTTASPGTRSAWATASSRTLRSDPRRHRVAAAGRPGARDGRRAHSPSASRGGAAPLDEACIGIGVSGGCEQGVKREDAADARLESCVDYEPFRTAP